MEETVEIPSLETQDGQKSHSAQLEKGGILSAIGKISGKLRVAIAALGLLVGGGIECAHKPKPKYIPHSQAHHERHVCLTASVIADQIWGGLGFESRTAESASEKVYPLIVEIIRQYFKERYTNIELVDLGILKRVAPKLNTSNHSFWTVPYPIAEIQRQLTKYIDETCDDVIGLTIAASIHRHMRLKYDRYYSDCAFIALGAGVVNVENGSEVMRTGGSKIYKHELDCLPNQRGTRAYDECVASETPPIQQLLDEASEEIEDLVEDDLLANYHPDQLPPLSLAKIEKNLAEKINELYGKFQKTEAPIPEPALGELRKLGSLYLSRFSASPGAERVRQILADIDAREERFRLAQEKRQKAQERISEGKEVRKFRDLLTQGKTAEERGAYEEALGFFMQARNAAFAVVNLYREAEIAIPHEIDSLGNELNRGIRENEGRIGVIHPRPQGIPLSSSEVIWEGFKFYIDAAKAVAVSPEFGAMIVKLVEVSDKIHQDLARDGFTAHLELRIVKPEFLSNKPIQNVDVTVTQKNPPYTSRTFRTTKEGIIEQGGRVSFYLRPGQYEITSPVFKDRYTVDIKEGQNSLTIELR